jgi:hypothetical protein
MTSVLPVVAPDVKLRVVDVATPVVPETVRLVAAEVEAAYPESPA